MDIKYGYSKVKYAGNGSQTDFAVPFPFLHRLDVSVALWDTTTGLPFIPEGGFSYTWLNDNTIQLLDYVPAANVEVWIERNSSLRGQLVDFADNVGVTERDLDTAYLQSMYIAQEALDEAGLRMLAGVSIDIAVDAAEAAQAAAEAAAASAAGVAATLGDEVADAQSAAADAAASAAAAAVSAASAADAAAGAVNGKMDKASNLSDVADVPTARGNLGLGTMALETAGDYMLAAAVNAALATKLDASAYTAADVFAKVLAEDGLASGLVAQLAAYANDSDLLDGQSAAYYTDIVSRLGYTPANMAGDTFTGAVGVTGGDVFVKGAMGWDAANDVAKLVFGSSTSDVTGLAAVFGSGLRFGVYKVGGNGTLGANSVDALTIAQDTGAVTMGGALTVGGVTTVATLTVAGVLYNGNNLNGTYPVANSGFALGGNFSAGQGEVDYYNTNTALPGGHRFYKQTGASAATLLLDLNATSAALSVPLSVAAGAVDSAALFTGTTAQTKVYVENSATDGDPVFVARIPSTRAWMWGIDDSDGDSWKLAPTEDADWADAAIIVTASGYVGIGVTPGSTSTASLQTAKAISQPREISVHAHGAVGNYNPADGSGSDDRAAIQAALDACYAAGGGTVVLDNKKYKLAGPITIPVGVTLKGPHGQIQGGYRANTAWSVGGYDPDTPGYGGRRFRSMGGALWVCFDAGRGNQTLPSRDNPTAASNWTNDAAYDVTAASVLGNYASRTAAIYLRGAIEGCYIFQASYDNQKAASYTDNALWNSAWNSGLMSGLAIRQDADDALVRSCFIGGFMEAVLSYLEGRLRVDNVHLDCMNGIEISSAFDVPYLSNIHAFPFCHDKNSSGSLVRRGEFMWIHDTVDWAKISDCFTYGHKIGFRLYNVNGTQLTNCSADNTSAEKTGFVGLSVISSQNTGIANFKAANREHGCYFQNSDNVTISNPIAVDCITGIQVAMGNATILGGNTNTANVGLLNTGAGTVKAVNPLFTSCTTNTSNTGGGTLTLL